MQFDLGLRFVIVFAVVHSVAQRPLVTKLLVAQLLVAKKVTCGRRPDS
jgi:hypothetical protein